jgi:3-phenylpropionate/trans-cinnamate dioxygenase ferredoxin reductase subunit
VSTQRIVVLGAGHAGLSIAETLRRKGFAGSLALVGAEPGLPYQRPPLSKQYLNREWDESRLVQRNAEFFQRQAIDCVSGDPVQAIDPHARRLHLASGRELAWDQLAIATGSRVRRLSVPGADLAGVHYLQTLAQARALRAQMAAARHVVVIGGGYIGLEGAAAFARAGKQVTLVNRGSELLSRAAGATVSDFLRRLHETNGVQMEIGQVVRAIDGDNDRVRAVVLADGRTLAADLVLVGIGAEPETTLAASAGLQCRDGILVDGCCRTSVNGIVAAGDCARFEHPLYDGRSVRLESIQNAVEQGRVAAATLLGEEQHYAAVPWFWSDQYDTKFQIAGLSEGHSIEVVRGDIETGRFSVFCYARKRLVAVESINAPADHMMARKLIMAGVSPTPDEAADPACALRDLLARAG